MYDHTDAARAVLKSAWEPDKGSKCVVFITGGPGCGKSRVLEELPILLRKRLLQDAENMLDDDCSALFQQLFHEDRLVQIQTTVGNGSSLCVAEKGMGGERIAAIRALYSAFCPANIRMSTFVGDAVGSVAEFSITDVMSAITKARHNYTLPVGTAQHPLFVTYAIDEAQELLVGDGVNKTSCP